MMVISLIRQQTLLIILFGVVAFILLVQFYKTFNNSNELKASREISQHSDEVGSTIRETNQLQKEADLCGRLALNGINHCNTSEKRQLTFKSVERLRLLVSDSQVQTENVNNLFNAIQTRFSTQDKVQNLGLGNGQLILTTAQSLELNEASIQVERMFNNLEAQEFSYLKSRHQKLSENEYYYNRSVFLLTLSCFISLWIFGYFAHRFLIRNKRVEKSIGDLLPEQIVGEDEVKIKKSTLIYIQSINRGEV